MVILIYLLLLLLYNWEPVKASRPAVPAGIHLFDIYVHILMCAFKIFKNYIKIKM